MCKIIEQYPTNYPFPSCLILGYTADMGNCIAIVKNVSSHICGQCGEVSYSDETAQRLEQIVHPLTEPVSAESAVVNYTEQAA